MEQTIFSIQSEQKRTDHARATRVTKSAHDAVGRANLLYLHRCRALARSICSVETFRDDTVQIASGFSKPIARNSVISSRRRKSDVFRRAQIRMRESFEPPPPVTQTVLQVRLPIFSEQIEN